MILHKIISIITTTLFIVALQGCGSNKLSYSDGFKNSNSTGRDYDICLYNSRNELSDEIMELCAAYEVETGVKVRVFNAQTYDMPEDTLHAQTSENANYDILSVNGLSEGVEFTKLLAAQDIASDVSEQLKEIVANLPVNDRLTPDNVHCYGVPYGMMAHSYYVDKGLVADMFRLKNVDTFFSDLAEASCADFDQFVVALNNYISQGAVSVTLNGRKYFFNKAKTERNRKITSVFSGVMYEETANLMLATSFKSPIETAFASKQRIDEVNFSKYVQTLKQQLRYSSSNHSSESSFFVRRLDVLKTKNKDRFIPVPIKYSVEDKKLCEEINNSLFVGPCEYFVLNAKSSVKCKKLAKNFLIWLNEENSNGLKRCMKNVLASETISKYKNNNRTLPIFCYSMPVVWLSDISNYSLTEDDGNISLYMLSKWKECI